MPRKPRKAVDMVQFRQRQEAKILARQEAVTSQRPAEEVDGDLFRVLRESTDPVEISKAAMRIAAKRLAASIGDEEISSLKKTVEEFRRAEGSAIELAKERGILIYRDEAKMAVAREVERAKRAFDMIQTKIGPKSEEWRAAGAELTAEDRMRVVRAWMEEQFKDVRRMCAKEIEAELAQIIAERGA